jgi:hypothetical protein
MLKNITLSADEELIQKGREKARKERTTLNANFRRWLSQYVNRGEKGADYRDLMMSLEYARPNRKFSREELHER